jgi:hypothetical protein
MYKTMKINVFCVALALLFFFPLCLIPFFLRPEVQFFIRINKVHPYFRDEIRE